jgi:hypothetical protein
VPFNTSGIVLISRIEPPGNPFGGTGGLYPMHKLAAAALYIMPYLQLCLSVLVLLVLLNRFLGPA